LRVFTGDGWRRSTNRRAYLYTAVLNNARDQHRSTQRRLRRESRSYEPASDADASVRPIVYEALRRLSVRQRAVVFLTYWDDLDLVEIASRLGISRATAGRDLAEARQRLKGLLG
jgi:RNA polymerase sigma factor (sigma-70 family)